MCVDYPRIPHLLEHLVSSAPLLQNPLLVLQSLLDQTLLDQQYQNNSQNKYHQLLLTQYLYHQLKYLRQQNNKLNSVQALRSHSQAYAARLNSRWPY
jgi:hypothetical protein